MTWKPLYTQNVIFLMLEKVLLKLQIKLSITFCSKYYKLLLFNKTLLNLKKTIKVKIMLILIISWSKNNYKFNIYNSII